MKQLILKSIITYVLIIILVILVILNIRLINNKLVKKFPNESDIEYNKEKNNIETERERVISNQKFYTVDLLIQKYFEVCSIGTEKADSKLGETYSEEEIKKANETRRDIAIDLLDRSYIESNEISRNIDNILNLYKEFTFNSKEMYFITKGDMEQYAVYGIMIDNKSTANFKKANFVINIDNKNNTYSIIPKNDEEYGSIEDISLKINEDKIEKNKNNAFKYIDKTDDEIAQMYFYNYKKQSLDNTVIAYSLLNNSYKEKRFPNVEEYNNFIEKNYSQLNNSTLKQYLVNEDEDYKEYICKDQYENLYIFTEKYPMDYNIKLDNYTIETEKFKEEYESGDVQKKVQLNINKFILMINNQDYASAYKVLDQNFKNNYFKTLEEFENYIVNNMYRYNKLEFYSFDVKGNIYVCETTLTDLTKGEYLDETKGTTGSGYALTWNFVMKLNEGTDFKISFEV